MIKSNSKRAIDNIKNYIISIYNTDSDREGLEEVPENPTMADFEAIAKNIYTCFIDEAYYNYNKMRYSEQEAFSLWCSGLCGAIHTGDYYLGQAVEVLGDILEETAEERAKFTRDKAEQMLDYLIYREIKKAIRK